MAEVSDESVLDWSASNGDIRARRLELALEATGLGLWEYDLSNGRFTWDGRARELFGAGSADPLDFADWVGRIHPEDRPAVCSAYDAAIKGADGGRCTIEHRTVGVDGRQRWVRGVAGVIFDAQNKAAWVLGSAQDVTEQVVARQRQALLLDELNHRVKNNIAAVQAIASHTLRSHLDDMSGFREAFQGRLLSLSRGHELLTLSAWNAPDLADVLRAALEPFERPAIALAPSPNTVRVAPELAVNLVLVMHELATNAAKYGALSQDGGEVRISWTTDAEALKVEWREQGGPAVSAPLRSGFGTRLKSVALRGFGGVAESEFAPGGVICRLRVPLGEAVSVEA